MVKEREKCNQDEILTCLKQVEILNPLSETELMELSGNLNCQKFGAGEILFRENEHSGSFYVIKSGLVEVNKQTKYGKSSVISMTATTKVLEDAEFIIITHDVFKKILANHPDIVELIHKKNEPSPSYRALGKAE
ncbi:MAG: cyclic nucleotide-binding domain-containing protein [bacterium]